MSFCHPLPQLLGRLRKGIALGKVRWGKAVPAGTLKGDPSTPTLAECRPRARWGETQLGECLGLAGAPVHGQGVPWQLPSPQHEVPAGWLGDATVMLSQSWEILPDLVHSFPQ